MCVNTLCWADLLSKNTLNTQKDMFFELIMIRFDILQEYRKAIINIFNFFKIRPKEFFMLLPSFIESMFLATHLSGISVKGIKGNVKIKGLLIVYFSSFLIWLKDESVSLEKTMTSLDLYLNRADKILKIFIPIAHTRHRHHCSCLMSAGPARL